VICIGLCVDGLEGHPRSCLFYSNTGIP
jgi:hypothetical protein